MKIKKYTGRKNKNVSDVHMILSVKVHNNMCFRNMSGRVTTLAQYGWNQPYSVPRSTPPLRLCQTWKWHFFYSLSSSPHPHPSNTSYCVISYPIPTTGTYENDTFHSLPPPPPNETLLTVQCVISYPFATHENDPFSGSEQYQHTLPTPSCHVC